MEIFVKILGGILTLAIVGYFVSKAESTETHGKLYFGRFTLVLSLCCFSFSALMLWVWIFVNHGGQDIPIALLFFGFGIGFIYTFLEYFFTRGTYDECGISYKRPWLGQRNYSWDDLQYIDYNDMLNWYVFEFFSGRKIRVSMYMHGQKGLFETIESIDINT